MRVHPRVSLYREAPNRGDGRGRCTAVRRTYTNMRAQAKSQCEAVSDVNDNLEMSWRKPRCGGGSRCKLSVADWLVRFSASTTKAYHSGVKEIG